MDRHIKVLHVINSLPMGGAERLLADLCPRLAEAGIEVEIVALGRAGDAHSQALRGNGIRVDFCSPSGIRSPLRVLDLSRAFRERRPDIVHAHLYPSILWSAAARGALPGGRLVLTEHNTLNRRMRYPFLQPLERWMYRRYDAVAAISEAVRDTLSSRLDGDIRRIEVIPNGVDLRRFECKAGTRPGLPARHADEINLVMAARMNQQKDQPTLLRALALLPPAYRLSLVGEGEELEPAKALASSLGLSDRVDFLGARSDVPDILSGADIYVQSSHWEGFGIAAVEAMAAGLPVVASAVPGLADVVGEAGLLFRQGDPRACAAAIRRLAENPELRELSRARGRERASLFSIERCAALYIDLYESLMSEGR